MPQSNTYAAPSVARALALLEQVARQPQGISELARRLGLSKGTVFGLCRQLEAGRALLRDPQSKRYALGPLVSELAGRVLAQVQLKEMAGPRLGRLRDELGESVFLGVRERGEVRVLDARQPAGVISLAVGPGTRMPLTAGAVGKVFLAGMPPDQVEEILARGLPAHTGASVTDPSEYRRQLDLVRGQGFAMESDEYLSGVWGAAAPLGGSLGLGAALGAIGFTSALIPGRLPEMARRLALACAELDQALEEAAGS